jgi:hypothetical protein
LKKSDLSEQKSGSGLFIGSDPLENVRHRASASDDTDAGKDKLGDDDDSSDSDKTDTDSTDKGDSGDDSRDTDGKD